LYQSKHWRFCADFLRRPHGLFTHRHCRGFVSCKLRAVSGREPRRRPDVDTFRAEGRPMNAKARNFAIISLCAAVFLAASTLVSFQVSAEMSCEAAGGIPARVFNFPSFVTCIT
jgi:hypothetical protein